MQKQIFRSEGTLNTNDSSTAAADVICLELQKPRTNVVFQCLSQVFFYCVDQVSFGLVDALKLHLC